MSVVNHIGISGGKDSTALLLWAVYESGYPLESIDATFCDTGNEHEWTYEHVAMLSEKVHPITGITPERDFYDLARHKKRFPGAKSRFCTQELKMIPTAAYIEYLEAQGHEVLMHSGVRASESDDRAALPEIEPAWMSYFGVPVYRPLLRWSFTDVLAIHKRYGIPMNPLYEHGAKRVGCLPCIMSRKKEIANIASKWPNRIDMIRDAEVSVKSHCGYSSMFPADKVPHRYRSKQIRTKPKPVKERRDKAQTFLLEIDREAPHSGVIPARDMMVATIDDAVRWAMNDPDIDTEEFDFYDDAPPACDSRYGACE